MLYVIVEVSYYLSSDGCFRIFDKKVVSYSRNLLEYDRSQLAVNIIRWEDRTDMSTVDERVHKIVMEQLGVKQEEISNESSFVDDLGADSLDTVELVMALEEEFETEIPDEEAEKITTVQHAVDYINKNVNVS